MPTKPEFRVRVFLSVDLVGSTAYKSKQADNRWINTFRKFYSGFLSKFRRNYVNYCEAHSECRSYARNFPALWKTVGDEAIFTNKVESLFQLYAYVHSFDLALAQYKDDLKSNLETADLDVKGNAWVASFPFPNQTIPKPNFNSEEATDSLPDEKDEIAADERPSDYDFLGSGIDAGFRISGNSTAAFMTLSPVLACLLATANTNRAMKKFEFDFVFQGMNELKGVLNSASYPIVGLSTERDPSSRKLSSLSGELTGANELDADTLVEFLETFIEYHSVDMPQYTDEVGGYKFSKPTSYDEKFVPYWDGLAKELVSVDEGRKESEKPSAGKVAKTKDTEEHLKAFQNALNELARLGQQRRKT